jgi:hypothetical protein
VSVAPVAPVTVPEMLYVVPAVVAVKFLPLTLDPLTLTTWLMGLNARPALLGVTV